MCEHSEKVEKRNKKNKHLAVTYYGIEFDENKKPYIEEQECFPPFNRANGFSKDKKYLYDQEGYADDIGDSRVSILYRDKEEAERMLEKPDETFFYVSNCDW